MKVNGQKLNKISEQMSYSRWFVIVQRKLLRTNSNVSSVVPPLE